MRTYVSLRDILVVAPNFKKRLSGVTSTVVQLVPKQREMGVKIASLAPDGLPDQVVCVRFRDLWRLWIKPEAGNCRVWHARRNTEMLPGIILRDVLRMKIKLLFTSDAQRDHRCFTKWLISRMDAVIAGSAQAASYLKVPSTLVMHGINTGQFMPPLDKAEAKRAIGFDPETRLVGCFGRIRSQKGTDRFVRAMIKLLPSHPQWKAVITGRVTIDNKEFAEAMQADINAAGLADRILFKGEVEDVTPWYQALDLFAAPQRWEGFGLTPLEAMACSVPVAATSVGAFKELVVEGKTGLVSDNSDAGFEAAIGTLMADDVVREAMARQCRAHVLGGFMLEREASQINAVYDRLLAS